MKKFLLGIFFVSTIAISAEAELLLTHGEEVQLYNKDSRITYIICGKVTDATENKIIIESGSSLTVTLGFVVISHFKSSKAPNVLVVNTKKLKVNCK